MHLNKASEYKNNAGNKFFVFNLVGKVVLVPIHISRANSEEVTFPMWQMVAILKNVNN